MEAQIVLLAHGRVKAEVGERSDGSQFLIGYLAPDTDDEALLEELSVEADADLSRLGIDRWH